MVSRSMVHNEGPQILCATVQNLVARMTRRLDCVHPGASRPSDTGQKAGLSAEMNIHVTSGVGTE